MKSTCAAGGLLALIALVSLAPVAGGCAVDAEEEDVDSVVEFLSSNEDEVIDPADPPDDPDPQLDAEEISVAAPAGNTVSSGLSKKKKKHKKGGKPDNGGMACGTANALSPAGLTFVFHVSKDDATAMRMVSHLRQSKGFIRDRDVFMVDHGSPAVGELRKMFPCNRFHAFVRQPNQLADTMKNLGDGYEAIAVDWELYEIRSQSQAWSTQRLSDFAEKIHANGKKAGFIPFWFGRSFSDKQVMRGSNMQYDLVQIQDACVESPVRFANAARNIARDFGGGGVRNVGFEISLDSYGKVDNHVNAARAAACTEKAYRKGARAIYVYGNGPDQLPEYLHRLGKEGIRRPD
jgi:hypothetical protein